MNDQATLPLLFVLSPVLPSDSEPALERRVRRSLFRREPVVLGTASTPYTSGGSGSPLQMLLTEEGLEIAITTATPRIVRELDLLVELDRRHSVTVQMVVPAWNAEDPEPRMGAVRRLAAEGIATRVLLQAVPDASGGGEETLRFLLEEAREAGAYDVEIDAGSHRRGERARLLADFGRLRLEHGFPQALSGRG